jgi:hypothetical protein
MAVNYPAASCGVFKNPNSKNLKNRNQPHLGASIEPTARSLIPPHRKRWGILSFFVKMAKERKNQAAIEAENQDSRMTEIK